MRSSLHAKTIPRGSFAFDIFTTVKAERVVTAARAFGEFLFLALLTGDLMPEENVMLIIPHTLFSADIATAGMPELLKLNDAICAYWAFHHPASERPDHIGWFHQEGNACWNFWRDDRSPRSPDEFTGLLGGRYQNCLLEFRRTIPDGDGWISLNMRGELIEGARGLLETPRMWSAMALRNATEWGAHGSLSKKQNSRGSATTKSA